MTAWRDLQRELEALLAVDATTRQQRLAKLQATNPKQALELQRLLDAAEGTRWDQQMAGGAAGDVVQALGEQLHQAQELSGTSIGPYHLVRLLGQGGMGAVYLAERADGAYQQQTALKIVPGRTLDSAAGERFVNERQILAQLAHPNIARLLDGGLTDTGSPYLVMEYVDGPDLVTHVQQHNLDLNARLALFNQLLDAVQFAHSNLVVHGDLKPDNILVDGQDQLKLLDFGIARALDRAHGDPNQALTPGYASPERLDGAPLSTSSDIYALGVVLYRLLAEQAPYDLAGVTATEMADKVRNTPMPALREVSNLNGVDNELELICQQAMAVELPQRYATTDNLRQDLARLAAHQPITAHPPSRRYRAAKFVRRHRLGVTASVLVALAIGAGSTTALIQADNARAQAARAEQVSGFLANLFDAANPFGAWKEEKSVVDLLEYADSRAKVELDKDPLVLAKVQAMLGEAYLGNGNYERAAAISRAVLATNQKTFGNNSVGAAQAHNQLAHALIELGSYEEAAEQATAAVTFYEAQGSAAQVELADALTNLAVAVSSAGNRAEAQRMHQRALAIREAQLPADHPSIADSKMSLASVSAALGQMADVVPLNRAAHKIYTARYGADHPMTVRAMNGIASGEFLVGNYQAAAMAFAQLLEEGNNRLGAEHPELALLHNNLGRALTELGQFKEATQAYQAAAERVTNAPSQRLLSISVRFNQAALAAELGNFGKALRQLEQAGSDFNALLGETHPLSYRAAVQLATARALAGMAMVQDQLQSLIDTHPGAVAQPQWQARARLALARLLLETGNSVTAATQLSAAQASLASSFTDTSWRFHDLQLLQAVANGRIESGAEHASALVELLPTSSVRRQYAERVAGTSAVEHATSPSLKRSNSGG